MASNPLPDNEEYNFAAVLPEKWIPTVRFASESIVFQINIGQIQEANADLGIWGALGDEGRGGTLSHFFLANPLFRLVNRQCDISESRDRECEKKKGTLWIRPWASALFNG